MNKIVFFDVGQLGQRKTMKSNKMVFGVYENQCFIPKFCKNNGKKIVSTRLENGQKKTTHLSNKPKFCRKFRYRLSSYKRVSVNCRGSY